MLQSFRLHLSQDSEVAMLLGEVLHELIPRLVQLGHLRRSQRRLDSESRQVRADLANRLAHYETTGPEIWRQTDGKVTHFIAGVGTCGTITGTGRFLKRRNPGVKVLAAIPEEGHDIPGVRSRRQLKQTKLYRPAEYDGDTEITNKEAFDLCLRLNREEFTRPIK